MTFKSNRYKVAHESFCVELKEKSFDKMEYKEEQSEFDFDESTTEHSEENEDVPTLDVEKSQAEYENVEKDPFAVEKFMKCPICKSVFAFYEHFSRHIEKFHRIPMQEFQSLDLKVQEYLVSTFMD